ncbi:NAC domain-containing protein 5-like [Pyrus communis]|uniref:NAC domain-containing protein 5-like n=1 Tax=Pyrus communis TaxID=23211 RepID=UPI0035C0FC2B
MASNGIPFTRAAAGGISLRVGFRFRPTEEELIGHYLQLKLRGMDSLVSDVIREINMCNHEPWDLPEMSLIKSDDEEWYFYNRPIYKKNSRNDTERATSEGFWKITGPVKDVRARDNKTIGKKRILTFYRGRGRNAQITPWVMHEFYIPQISPNANQRDFVLCHVKKNCHVKKKSSKNTDVATCDEGESSNHNNAPDFENQPQPPHNMGAEEEHNQPPQNLDIFQWHMGSMPANAHDNNEYHGMQSALAADERDENSDEEFANTLIVDPYQDSSEEMTHTNVFNDSTLPESPRKVYLEDCGVSSDSDTEVPHARGVAQCMSSQILSVPQAGSSLSGREKAVMLRNQIFRQAASSIDVLPKPETDRLQSGPADLLTSALVALGKVNELKQQQSKAKEAAERRAAVDFPTKRNFITESNKDAEAVQGNNTEKGLKRTHNATTAGNWMSCSLISWETSPPLTSPPSVYLFNTVLGAILFFVFARELVLYGQW